MNSKKSIIRLIGRREYVSFPLLNIKKLEAKIDTGAYTCSIHCEDISLSIIDNIPTLIFSISDDPLSPAKEFKFTEFSTKKIKNSFGEMEERYIIKTVLKIGLKNIIATISLSNRDNMRYPILIGRKPLKGKFIIDVNQLHTGAPIAKKALKKVLKPV